jgi:serine/threonine-protein kinase
LTVFQAGDAMSSHPTDETFAGYVTKYAIATPPQIEAARAFQSQTSREGVTASLADALVSLGIITPAIKENVEQKIQAQQKGVSQLLHYKLLKKLGEGGMGSVYLAEDSVHNRQVALKILPPRHAGNAEFLKRFQREADAMGRLHHVNIVRAYSVGEDQGRHFIAMEYCDGETLDKRIKREGRIPHGKAMEITIQVARGLQYAHERGLIHRDIKPANVIMTGDIAKILDLGLSKNLEREDGSFLTQSGVALGTPHYISPEQARGEKDLDGRADIYSLGATLYHLVTGDTPFHGSSAFEVVTKHLNEQLPDPRDLQEGIPEGVAHVIRRMMAKDRKHRYRNCAELLKDLERVVDGLEPSSEAIDASLSSVAMRRGGRRKGAAGGAHRATATPAARAAQPPWAVQIGRFVIPRRTVLLVGVGAPLGILIVVLTFALRGDSKPSPPTRLASREQPAGTPDRAIPPSPPPTPKDATPREASIDPATPPPPEEADLKKIREDSARNQLNALLTLEREGRQTPESMTRSLEGLADSYGDTRAGREAREIADRMKVSVKTPPKTDPAASAKQEPVPVPPPSRVPPANKPWMPVPYSQVESALWRHTFVKPADDWSRPGFDDSTWKESAGAFGSTTPPGMKVRTWWNTTEIWLRREFVLEEPLPVEPQIFIHHQGDATVYLNGTPACSRPFSLWKSRIALLDIAPAARATLKAGKNLIAVHCSGDGTSNLIDLGLFNTAGLIRSWAVIGSFPGMGPPPFDVEFIPEHEVDFASTYVGASGPLRWQRCEEARIVNLRRFTPNQGCVAYAATYLESPDEMDAWLLLGSDDGHRAWLNGQMVSEKRTFRILSLCEECVPVRLRKGSNVLKLKIVQAGGDWAFAAGLVGPEGKPIPGLKWSVPTSLPLSAAPEEDGAPKDPARMVEMIQRMRYTDSGKQALELFAPAKKLGLTDAQSWFKLGMCLHDGGYYQEGLEAFQRMEKTGGQVPSPKWAIIWQGHMLDLLGRRKEALERYQTVLNGGGFPGVRHDQYGIVLDRRWVEERIRNPYQRPNKVPGIPF